MSIATISVIVPIYNVESFLYDCLLSIKNQRYQNFECICVIDGSKDNSINIARSFEKKDCRFTVIEQENKGLAGARNTGIKNAKGDFICFVDSDDIIDVNFLDVLINLQKKYQSDYISCTLKTISEQKKYSTLKFSETRNVFNIVSVSNNPLIEILRDQHPFNVSACMHLFKTSIISELHFPEEMKMHEDTIFSILALSNARNAIHINLPLYLYRERFGSITRSNSYISSANFLQKNIYSGAKIGRKLNLPKSEFNSLISKCGMHELSNIAVRIILDRSLPKKERNLIFNYLKHLIKELKHQKLFPINTLNIFIKAGVLFSYFFNLKPLFRFTYSIIWNNEWRKNRIYE